MYFRPGFSNKMEARFKFVRSCAFFLVFEKFIIIVDAIYYFFPLISFDKLLFQQTPKSASLYFYYNCLITFQYCNGY